MTKLVTFEDWLANYASRPYKSLTIKHYIAALEKVQERLGVELSTPILSCTSIDDFTEMYNLVTAHKDYSRVNNIYGHGELSAALSAYKKYLIFLNKTPLYGTDVTIYSPEWFRNVAQNEEMITFDQKAISLRMSFIERFGIEKIEQLSGRELLKTLFISDDDNRDNLSYTLEFNSDIREVFGSIAGGSSYKYGLFYHKKLQSWMTGSPVRPKYLSEEEAIALASSIRDNIVKGARILAAHKEMTAISDYEILQRELQGIPGIDAVWILKYYQMLFPEILPVFYAKPVQIEVLRFLKKEPSILPLIRMGQISLFEKECGISSPVFGKIYHTYYKAIGDNAQDDMDDADSDIDALADTKETSVSYWIYTPGEGSSLWKEHYDKGIMAIGWGYIGDLRQYASKDEMKTKMRELKDASLSYMNAAHATWQFANEMKIGDIVFAKRGRNLIIGRGIVTSDYIYDESEEDFRNIRQVNWTHQGEWEHPGQAVVKTLTDITAYTDYIKKLNNLFVEEDEMEEETPVVSYSKYNEKDFLKDVFMDTEKYHDLVALIRKKKNIILQGAPGVGKTFAAKRLAYSMMGVKDQERVMMIQFHQSYSYEDFIEGYRPSGNGFEIKKGVFYNFCKKAEIDSENDYFFIIDEINRGNLSKIFGELFMLIEGDKRGIQLRLLYSDEKFAVPENVYLIGMMNTADRSLALLDYALRRRFAFYDMVPGFDTEGFRQYRMNLNNDDFNRLIDQVERLNHAIAADDSLGEGFCIGHSYFCNLTAEKVTDQALSAIVEYELIPLLKEYWFDEPTKVKDWANNLRSAIK